MYFSFISRHFQTETRSPIAYNTIIKKLLNHKAEVDTYADTLHYTPLHCASHFGNLSVVQLLVETGLCDINRTCKEVLQTTRGRRLGMRAVDAAMKQGHEDVVRYLIDKGKAEFSINHWEDIPDIVTIFEERQSFHRWLVNNINLET